MSREPESNPWFYQPALIIAIFFLALIVTDYIDRAAERATQTEVRYGAAR